MAITQRPVQSSEDSPVPSPTTLQELIAALRHELGEHGLDSEHVDLQRIQAIMTSYRSQIGDWRKFAHFDEQKHYTRNLVDDGNGKFNLMILCWNPGRTSPIHDHSRAHCIMKVLKGTLLESQYEWPKSSLTASNDDGCTESSPCNKQPMTLKRRNVYKTNEVAYINDNIAIHCVGNPSETNQAVSLHLYTPPYEYCKTFCPETGEARSSGRCLFYTRNGQRCSSRDDIRCSVPMTTL